jgi:formylglycine-generating enzyme required for sulfatase activity
MGSNPSYFKECGDNCPVEQVSWNAAKDFIQKLNAKTGKQYRLPSEAEWEYACRAGGRNEYCGSGNIDSVAWYGSNSGSKTHAVARKQANAWGLRDMSGNAWEWVEDCWNGNYNGAPSDGSAWTTGECSWRVLRGGSWVENPRYARAAFRYRGGASGRANHSGFRLARMLREPPPEKSVGRGTFGG